MRKRTGRLYNEMQGNNITLQNATMGRTWLTQMSNAAEANDCGIQYCMTFPRMLMSSVELAAVSQWRASDDYGAGQTVGCSFPCVVATACRGAFFFFFFGYCCGDVSELCAKPGKGLDIWRSIRQCAAHTQTHRLTDSPTHAPIHRPTNTCLHTRTHIRNTLGTQTHTHTHRARGHARGPVHRHLDHHQLALRLP